LESTPRKKPCSTSSTAAAGRLWRRSKNTRPPATTIARSCGRRWRCAVCAMPP
jgi:hypothetical protein